MLKLACCAVGLAAFLSGGTPTQPVGMSTTEACGTACETPCVTQVVKGMPTLPAVSRMPAVP